MSRSELAELAAWAETRLPQLIDDACAATVERIPFYRDDQIVPAEELRGSIERNLRFLVSAIGHPEAPLDLAAPEATGRRRAYQGAPLPEASLPDVERRLAAHGIVSGWRLTPNQQLGVISVTTEQRETMLAVLGEIALARTGVSPPYRSLADTPRALRLAQAALSGPPSPDKTELRVFDDSPLAALMVCEPAEGHRLANEVLGPVLGLPPEDRTMLLDTLSAYLDHAGSAERAAEALYCHPNTVRYRLRRLQELTGRSLSDPRSLAELAAAAYALSLGSATA